MNKKTENRIKEILVELEAIATKEKCPISIYAKKGYTSANNDYWQQSKRKGFAFWSGDKGATWTDLLSLL